MRDEEALYKELKEEFNRLLVKPRFTRVNQFFYAAGIADVIEILNKKIRDIEIEH